MIVVIGCKNYGDPLEHIDKIVSDTRELLKRPKEVSLVMFTGGEDVHPSLYGGVDGSNLCGTNIRRDGFEKKVFGFCRKHDIKCWGICRGSQFLNVMAGGFMYQHIENHTSYHNAYFPHDKSVRKVTSTHHQLVGLPSSSIPIAWSHPSRSGIYIGPYGHRVKAPEHEIEAAIFPNINAVGVQYHPEMMSIDEPGRVLFVNMVKDFLENSMETFINLYGVKKDDVHNNPLVGGTYRVSAS